MPDFLRRLLVPLVALAVAASAVGPFRSVLAQPPLDNAPSVIPADRAGLKGMVSHWWDADQYGRRFLDQYAQLGVTNVRLAVDWKAIEAAEGQRDFSRLDPIMAGFRDRGIEVVPVIATVPSWAALNPDECALRELVCLLDRDKGEDFRETMAQLVSRYPEVRRWEFWNEPEMWYAVRDPVDYEWWYRVFYRVVKEIKPSARVAVGTLAGWPFFSRLSPDVPADAVSIHSYAGSSGDLLETDRIVRLHDGLVSRGRTIPIWLTEYGWDSKWMPNADRAKAIGWVFAWLLDHPYIELAHYHMLQDDEHGGCCFGIVGAAPDFAPKQPAYDVFRSYLVGQ
jgi:hypothetical protein